MYIVGFVRLVPPSQVIRLFFLSISSTKKHFLVIQHTYTYTFTQTQKTLENKVVREFGEAIQVNSGTRMSLVIGLVVCFLFT